MIVVFQVLAVALECIAQTPADRSFSCIAVFACRIDPKICYSQAEAVQIFAIKHEIAPVYSIFRNLSSSLARAFWKVVSPFLYLSMKYALNPFNYVKSCNIAFLRLIIQVPRKSCWQFRKCFTRKDYARQRQFLTFLKSLLKSQAI